MAPETEERNPYDQAVDIWACGIILYILCSGGKHPIYKRDLDKDEYNKLARAHKEWTFPEEFPM